MLGPFFIYIAPLSIAPHLSGDRCILGAFLVTWCILGAFDTDISYHIIEEHQTLKFSFFPPNVSYYLQWTHVIKTKHFVSQDNLNLYYWRIQSKYHKNNSIKPQVPDSCRIVIGVPGYLAPSELLSRRITDFGANEGILRAKLYFLIPCVSRHCIYFIIKINK